MANEKILTLLHLAEEEAQRVLAQSAGRLKPMVSSEGGLEKLIGLRFVQFWRKVDIGRNEACWPWKGTRFKITPRHLPYGKATLMRYCTTSHRIAYLLTHGEIDQDMDVLHRCDNPPCCNPLHLFLGDDFINAQDALAKGRNNNGRLKGEASGSAKLTDQQVRDIRMLREYGYGLRPIAEIFNICFQNVSLICLNKHWKHI